MPYPKIELHLHLEGTVRPGTLLEIARRNDYALPADTVEGLAELYRFRDFAHFIGVWVMTTAALQRAADYRQIVVDYAAEAAAHGAVYIEGIFSPARPVLDGSSWEAPDSRHPPRLRPRGRRKDTPARSPGSSRSAAPSRGSAPTASATASARSKIRRWSASSPTAAPSSTSARSAMGLSPRGFFDAGVEGALCDEATKGVLRRIGDSYNWPVPVSPSARKD